MSVNNMLKSQILHALNGTEVSPQVLEDLIMMYQTKILTNNNMPNNPPAFPITPDLSGDYCPGMTLRDYFAGQVIAGSFNLSQEHTKYISERAYEIADALLAEREKTNK